MALLRGEVRESGLEFECFTYSSLPQLNPFYLIEFTLQWGRRFCVVGEAFVGEVPERVVRRHTSSIAASIQQRQSAEEPVRWGFETDDASVDFQSERYLCYSNESVQVPSADASCVKWVTMRWVVNSPHIYRPQLIPSTLYNEGVDQFQKFLANHRLNHAYFESKFIIIWEILNFFA